MYRKEEQTPISPENFFFPLEGKLSQENRWVIMAELIPWSEFESEYATLFSEEMGAPAKSFRMALGAIKKQLHIKRNLSHIEQLVLSGASLENLSNRQYKMLLVVAEVYRQHHD